MLTVREEDEVVKLYFRIKPKQMKKKGTIKDKKG